MNQQHYIVITTQEEREAFGPAREGLEFYDAKNSRWIPTILESGEGLAPFSTYRFPVATAPGWISLKERMPTAADADKYGQAVFFTNIGRQTIAPWRCEGFRANVFTHFRPFTTPPAPPKELTQEEKDDALWINYYSKNTGLPGIKECNKSTFLAGLRAAREQVAKGGAK